MNAELCSRRVQVDFSRWTWDRGAGRGAVGWVSILAGVVFTTGGNAAEYRLNGHTFTLPDGFVIEQVAGTPLVDRPIVADFDEEGRLYVADSSGSNDPVRQQLETKPHRIVRLEDTDGDGRFDKSVVFADRMMFPEGALWHEGSLYVGAPPSIWKLTDTDGDGVAEHREEWLDAQTLTGCANDLHGPYLGPDGLIYWCKGAFAKQEYARPDGSTFVTRAAHIFRREAVGGWIEPVMAGGMDNPVDVAFTPEGERIFTTTFFQHPGGGRRDGLVHAIYGGVYGKIHNVIDDHPRTGEVMPVLTHLGPAAPCGLTRYDSGIFGSDYRNNFFACLFNLHKVTRHVLTREGAMYRSADSDFLVSDNVDFHPTDVQEDADGSLLVVDTGGWYKICCPTSQLYKPDVLGAIYRIRRLGAPAIQDPRGRKLDWNNLTVAERVPLLTDPRSAVRQRAVASLAKRPGGAEAALSELATKGKSVEARRQAVWALTRMQGSNLAPAVRKALRDDDASVQLTALHAVALRRDAEALRTLIELLPHASAPVQRAVAEALGRIGDKQAVPALLAAAAGQHDRVLEHSLIYALIEIGDPESTRRGLASAQAGTRQAALMALDQMKDGGLKAGEVAPALTASEGKLKETAFWIVDRHPEWGGALSAFLQERLGAEKLSPAEQEELPRLLARFSEDAAVQRILAEAAGSVSGSRASREVALSAMTQSRVKTLPKAWENVLQRLILGSDSDLVRLAVGAARALPKPQGDTSGWEEALWKVGRDAASAADVRLTALTALPGGLNSPAPADFQFLLTSLDAHQPVQTRNLAAGLLARAHLEPGQLEALANAFSRVGPLELGKVLTAFAKCQDEALGKKLVAALRQTPALSSLRPEMLRPALTNFPPSVQQQGEALLASLNVDAGKQQAHLDDLLGQLKGGDVRRGQEVFNSTRAACSSCHAIGYLGGDAGPDLTRIGQVRTERDLLEAIVYPSVSFVRSYEPLIVVTKTEEEYSGVLRQDGDEEIVLATGPGVVMRVARNDIAELRPGTLSIMPGGLDEQLTHQELADLIAFLKATRW